MKEIKRSQLISYRWWRGGENEIKPEHIEALEERADERIAEMMAQGYTSGELNDHIHMTDDDPEDGVEYRGWWDVSESMPKPNPNESKIRIVHIDNGDLAIFLNGRLTASAERAQGDPQDSLVHQALAFAEILNIPYQEVNVPVPDSEDWSFQDAYELAFQKEEQEQGVDRALQSAMSARRAGPEP